MMSRSFGALLASLSAAALLLAPSDSFARPGGAVAHAATPSGPAVRPLIAPGARFRGRNTPWVYWPGGGGFYYDNAGYGQPFAETHQPAPPTCRTTLPMAVPGPR